MRAISLVNRLEFQFLGNVARNAVILGDVDNDGCHELVVGSNNGEVAIFKGKERVQTISDLSFVSCIAIGDIFNKQKNSLVIITADGWCYIYDYPAKSCEEAAAAPKRESEDQVDGQIYSNSSETATLETSTNCSQSIKNDKPQLICIHTQRIPANAKNILLGDIDNDGQLEMILGLTDRVVRSYRWFDESANKQQNDQSASGQHLGRLVALNKWECANQIGSITLHHTQNGKPSLLIAQPGGTFMRIRCQVDEAVALLESGESGGSEPLAGSAVDYQFLGISRMRSQNISTEILGDFKCNQSSVMDNGEEKKVASKCPYAVATLDGTIMLVEDEVILWAIAVDHQIFALTKLDVTGNGSDDIVVCAWDGQTYILDQAKNCVRFHLNEPVQAFHSGYYNILANDKKPVTCLVYITFKNSIILYYDIPLQELMCKKYEPSPELLEMFYLKDGKMSREEAQEKVNKLDKKTKNQLIHYLLYKIKS